MEDNKNSYFKITMRVTEGHSKNDYGKIYIDLEDKIEPVLTKVGAGTETYTIYNTQDRREVNYIFKTSRRQRIAFLRNTIKNNIKQYSDEEYASLNTEEEKWGYTYSHRKIPQVKLVEALTKTNFNNELKKFKSNTDLYRIKGESKLTYKGKDIQRFENKDNWFMWQRKFYDMVYNEHGSYKEADEREIIFIEDLAGKAGKSKFWKYLYSRDPHNIGLLNEATSSQLKSNIVKLGERRLYIIDLPRTKGEVGYDGLASALELLKNGMINTSMYGEDSVLISRPPFIVVTGNKMPEAGWSVDRWKVYSLKNVKGKKTADNYVDKDWVDITAKKTQRVMEVMRVNNEIEDQSLNLKKIKLQNIKRQIKKELVF
jgi:hypothetical protein